MIKSFPFAGKYIGVGDDGFPISDRDYNDGDLASYVSNIRLNGIIERDNNAMLVTSSAGREIRINFGSIHINGRHAEIYKEPEYLTLDPGDSLPRIDLISMRLDLSDEVRAITPVIIRGAPAASPVMPDLTRNIVKYDMILAKINIPANAVSLTQGNITDTRKDKNICGMYNWTLDEKGSPNGVAPLDENIMVPENYLPLILTGVGSTISTIRKDLPNSWLLCNGDTIKETDYPKLTALLGPNRLTVNFPWSYKSSFFGGTPTSLAYGNGYWVQVGLNYIKYKTGDLLAGSWTTITTTLDANAVKYVNGYWFVLGTQGQFLYRATNPAGTFTAGNVPNTYTLNCIDYGNGYYCIGDAGGYVNYATAPNATWTAQIMPGTGSIKAIAYGNNYWACGQGTSSLCYKATNPAGTWTKNSTTLGTNSDLSFGNGYFVWCQTFSGIYYFTNPSGTPTQNTEGISISPSHLISHASYENGFWILGSSNENVIYVRADNPVGTISEPWKKVATAAGVSVKKAYFDGTYWAGADKSGDVLHYIIKAHKLPTVTGDLYTYIKAG